MPDLSIRVAAIEETPRTFALETGPAWWEAARDLFARENGEVPRHARARLDLEAYRIGRRLLLRGDLEAVLGLVCGWCVEPIDFPVRERVELLLEPSQNPGAIPEGGIELDPEDIGLGRYAGENLDLGQLILEILSLAWPMQPRESEACPEGCPRWQAGRAPVAGEKTDTTNRPFAGLDELLARTGSTAIPDGKPDGNEE